MSPHNIDGVTSSSARSELRKSAPVTLLACTSAILITVGILAVEPGFLCTKRFSWYTLSEVGAGRQTGGSLPI
jgi:hypothetical protein